MSEVRPAARPSPLNDLAIRKAEPRDSESMLALINGYAEKGMLLKRSRESLSEHLPDFSVIERGGEIVAVGALSQLGPGLGEIRSIAVREDQAGRGIGHVLVNALFDQAAGRGFDEVLALTRRVSFFEALGFEVSRRERFIDKLMVDCAACPLNLCCDETAVVKPVHPLRVHDMPSSPKFEEKKDR